MKSVKNKVNFKKVIQFYICYVMKNAQKNKIFNILSEIYILQNTFYSKTVRKSKT